MEVLGVIAGLPGLIEIVQKTVEVASQLKNWKSLSDEMAILLQQLEGLANTLKGVQNRGAAPSISPSQVARFQASLEKIRNDLTHLNNLLAHCNTSNKKGGIRFMKKAKLLLTGFDKTTKKHVERIRDARAELTLALVSQVHQDSSRSRSRSDLLFQLEGMLCPFSCEFIPQKLDTTCKWIWSHAQLTTWVNHSEDVPSDFHQRLFCLYGPKGCGKSVLSASMVDDLQAEGKISTFFSFWAGSESQRKFNGFLKTILWQLIQYLTAEDITQVASILMGISARDVKSLREALNFTIKIIKSGVYIVIDGIDEAEKDWNDPEDQSLSTIFDLLKVHPNVHILLCGRESSLIRAISSSSLSLKISQDFIKNDINTLIEWHLVQSSKSHITQSKDLVRDSLRAKSEMMFLWVNLVFKELNRSPSTSAMREILRNTPPTLDEEYNRMFESLMKRLGGSSRRPSVTMKTVKRIFALILAAPEPLKATELSYAYVAEARVPSAHEFELLSREELIDLCGDFIQESNSQFHFVHASIEEFLTRPADQWIHADSNVLYFRVDRPKSQGKLLESCFNYIRSMEMGYPIHDKSMQILPQSYPFFQYAARFIPVLLVNTPPIIIKLAFQDFLASKQFCGLVEYVIHTLEMDSWNIPLQYLDILFSLDDLSIPKSTLRTAINVELCRRGEELGVNDARYQTWAAIVGMLSAYLDRSDTECVQHDASDITAGLSTHLGALIVHYTARSHAASLAQLRPDFSALIRNRFSESLRSVPITIVPTWVLVLWAIGIWNEKRENVPRARPMLEESLRRVRKRRNFTESVCLLYLGIFEDHAAQIKHGREHCRLSSWFLESLEIAQSLPSSPQVEAVIQRALCGVTEALLIHEDRENAMIYSRQLENSVCNNEVVRDDSGWLKRVFYRGSAWAKWRVLVLGIHTGTLDDHEINEDSMRLHLFVLDLLAERKWDQMSKFLRWRWGMSLVLWNLGRVEECRASVQVILEHLQRVEGTRYCAEYWIKTICVLVNCLFKQDKVDEARMWLSRIPLAPTPHIPGPLRWLGLDLLHLGCIDRALELYTSWGREKLLEDLEKLKWDQLLDEAAIEQVLEMGVDAKDELETAALLDASKNGETSIVEFLLAQEGNIESRRHFREYTPLSLAVEAGHVSIVKLLLDQGAKYEWPSSFEWTPLTLAADREHELVMKLLLDHGADKNGRDQVGYTPLLQATYRGNVSIIRLLLDYGVDKNCQDLKGSTPLLLATYLGYASVVKLLLENGVDHGCQNSRGCTPLALAVQRGNVSMVKLLLDYGADKNFQDLNRWTPLTRAVRCGYYLVVKLLLDYGADKNGQDSYRWTPLTRAIRQGDDLVAKLLLDYGTDIEGRDSDGWTPLTLAAYRGRDFVVKLLLNYGANENGHDAWGWTPITRAACKGHSTIVHLLLDHGVDKNGRDVWLCPNNRGETS